MNTNVVIIGGGVIGSSVAYFLRQSGRSIDVTVVERDPSYTYASSTRSIASIRQHFSTPLSIQMSQYGVEFLRQAGDLLGLDGLASGIELVENGYLFLATDAEKEAILRQNHAVQIAYGAPIEWLDRSALRSRFPWLNTQDLVAGTCGLRGEGWFDGHLLLHALRKKAIALGARYVRDSVCAVRMDGRRVAVICTEEGANLAADLVINAAGAWARPIAQMMGVELPVHARRRSVFFVTTPTPMGRAPLVVDPSGAYVRPEGAGYVCGAGPNVDDDRDDLPLDEVDYSLFDEVVWPALAHRIPQFESLRVRSAWSGYYEFNPFDQNAWIGFHPEVDNCIFANGFSGHGMQQAAAAGRGISELVLYERFTTLDLSPLGFRRLLEGRPLLERNVI